MGVGRWRGRVDRVGVVAPMILSVFDPHRRVYLYYRARKAPILRRRNAYATLPLIEDIVVEMPPVEDVAFEGAGFLPRGVIAEKPLGWGEEEQTDHRQEAANGAGVVGWMALSFVLGALAGKAFENV